MLVKSIPLNESEDVMVKFRTIPEEINYHVPAGYKAVMHITVDVFPVKVIFVPGNNPNFSGKGG